MSSLINKCTVEEFRAVIAGDGDCQVVDVREYSEFEAERVSGARLVPLPSFDRQANAIDRDRPVYLMCRSGNRASKAAEKLHKLGYADVRVIEGGMQAWVAAGHPVERGEGRVWSLERQVRFVAGLIVLASAALAWFVNPGFVWLAGFIGAGLAFAAVTDTCAMGMLLARMPWNQKPKETSKNCAPGQI